MYSTFQLEDLLNVLISLEIKGYIGYEKMSILTKDKDLSLLFMELSKQEKNHKIMYEMYKKKFIIYKQSEITDDYNAYISGLLNHITKILEIGKFENLDDAYELALQIERETILLLTELKSILPDDVSSEISSLIDEERKHVVYILKLKSGEKVIIDK